MTVTQQDGETTLLSFCSIRTKKTTNPQICSNSRESSLNASPSRLG